MEKKFQAAEKISFICKYVCTKNKENPSSTFKDTRNHSHQNLKKNKYSF